MKLTFWISLPVSIICLFANAQTTTTTATTSTASTPAKSTVSAPATSAVKTAGTPSVATSTVAAPVKTEDPKVKFNLIYGLGYTLQAQTQPDGSRSQSLGHDFTPGVSYGDYSGFAAISYSQDLIDSGTTGSWSDPVFGVGKKAWTLGDYFKLGPSASVMLPMTDSTKNEVSLLYNLGAALKLSLNTKTLGLDALSVAYQLGMNRNFTRFDTNAKSGAPNQAYRIRNRFDIGYSITDALSFFNRLDFDSNYSVNGVLTNKFNHFQSFSYAINDNLSTSITHSNSGAYLKSQTYENNLKFFDSSSSEYSVGLELAL